MFHKLTLEELLKTKKISQRTYDKAKIAKEIIERKYNLKGMQLTKWNYILEKINSLDFCEEEKVKLKQEIFTQESSKYRFYREKQTIRDYESIAIIGRGAFGEVHVCRHKLTGEIVAIKKIKKEVLYLKNQVIHIRNEQIFMSKVKSPWIVELKASFQDDDYLYLIMEYLPGGDLMNLFIKKDILTEDEARFYIAELILAIESIHKLDCIHRDIKPDNILIDKTGHIKLSDFGLAKISEKLFEKENNNSFVYNNSNENNVNKHEKIYSCVGTAYYVAPEVLSKVGYGPEIDWWSVGVIFFEMLAGYAPFCSKETSEVCHKILNWKKYLKFPSKIKISREAEDLIAKLINNSNIRLGINGAEEIKSHPFFKDLNWENIHNLKAPFIPELKNKYDTHYFDNYEVIEPFYPPIKKRKKRKDIEYLGYTYKNDPKNNIDIFNEFQIAIEKLNMNSKNGNNNKNLNDTLGGLTECQSKKSSKKIENKLNLNNNINIKNCMDLNSKTEPNIDIKIIEENNLKEKKNNNYLRNNSITQKENNNINNNKKEEKKNINSQKYISSKEKQMKLNIIQLPSKKIINTGKNIKMTKNNKLISKNNNNKKNENSKQISKKNSQKKSLKKINKIINTDNNSKINNSTIKKKTVKLSPSPNQKNIFLTKYMDKSKLNQKEIRGSSDHNSLKIKMVLNNTIKKSISQNQINRKKNNSIKNCSNSIKKNVEGKMVLYNKVNNSNKNNKNNKKINIISIKNNNEILNSSECSISTSKITYIYKKK